MGPATKRKAMNEARFQIENERLDRQADGEGPVAPDRVGFRCECSHTDCDTVLLLTIEEYAGVRTRRRQGLQAHRHLDSSIERLVEQHPRYDVIETLGPAGRIVAAADSNPPPLGL